MRCHPRVGVSLFVCAALALTPLPLGASGPILVTGAGEPAVWGPGPIPYNPDQGTLGLLDNGTAVASVGSNFAVWAAVSTANVSFVNAGSLPEDVTAANVGSYLGFCDGLSPIVFDTDGSITDALFGTGAADIVLGFAGPECGNFQNPTITLTEGLAVLNGRWIDGNAPDISLAEFNGVFVHEFGHYLGLDHSQINESEAFDGDPGNDEAIATMFPFLVGADLATLHLDDRVSVLYLVSGGLV